MLKPSTIRSFQRERKIYLKRQMKPEEIANEQYARKQEEMRKLAEAEAQRAAAYAPQRSGIGPLGTAALVAGAWYVKHCFDGLDPHSKSDD